VTPDVETMVYPNGEHMDKFGFFLADRYAYDELWNLTDSLRDYKAQRWNLWARTWDNYEVITNDAGEAVTCWEHSDCGSDDQVLDYEAKRCIKDSLYEAGTCYNSRLHAHKDRGLKPVIYHMASNIPEATRQQHYDSAEQWNDVMKDTVAWLLTLEEFDRYWTRSCTTDQDCTDGRTDILVDQTVDTPRTVATSPDASGNCNGGAVAVNGECLFGVSCDPATNPCDKNQVCSSGSCFWKEGSGQSGQVLNPALTNGARGITMVIANSAEGVVAVPVQDDFQNPTLAGGQAIIRFVNTSGADATLTVGGTEVASATSGIDWVKAAAAAQAGSVQVSAGGQTITADIATNQYHIVVLSTDGLYVSPALQTTGDGIRFLHMVDGGGFVDAGANGIRTAENLGFQGVSERTPIPFDEARVVVSTAGAQGDVTCYYTMHEGRCTGWAGNWTDEMQARFNEVKANVPPMWLICENEYDAANELADYEGAQGNYDTTYNNGRYSTLGTNPYAPGGAAAHDGIFNPCKDMVEEPTQIKKIGDMRYNFVYWVGEAQASSPLGYGPSAGDPETGELVWGTAYCYGAPTLTYGESSKDLVDLINGDLNSEDVITGEYIRQFVEAKGDPLSPYNGDTLYYGQMDEYSRLPATEMYKRNGQFDRDGVVHPFEHFSVDAQTELAEFITDKQLRKSMLKGLPTVNNTYAKDRLDKVRGTPIEDLLITEEVKRGLSGGQLTGNLSDEIREAMSPATWANSVAQNRDRKIDRTLLATAPCTYDRAFVDDNIYGLAKEFSCTEAEREQWLNDPSSLDGKTCLKGDELRWGITNRILGGLIEHEVGHTMGLRHNFAASADLFNFKDEYFDVRQPERIYCKSNGHCDEDDGELCQFANCTTSEQCPEGLQCSAGVCVDGNNENTGLCALNGEPVTKLAPRPYQTEQERLKKISEYQYSSVMDYGGTFNSNIHGLGKYDYAAIRFAYGKLVDVYTDTSNIRGRINRLAQVSGRDPSIYSYYLDTSSWKFAGVLFNPFHYLEDHIGVAENLKRRVVTYDQVKYEQAMQDNYDYDSLYWTHIEVPYRFCGDEFRGNLGCYTWDNGVDVGEMVHNAIGKLNEYYIIDAFKRESMFRGDDSFVSSYFARILSRYMAVLGDSARYYAIYDNIFGDRPWYPDFSTNIYQMGTLRRASETSFNALAQVLATPAPGAFMQDTDGVYRNVSYDTEMAGADLTVPVGIGKFPYTQYLSPDLYGFENHVLFVGSFWTKLAALLTLTDSTFYSSADWVGEQLEIGRSSSVGFNTLYQTEMTNLLGGIIAESLENFSYVADTEGSQLSLRARDLFNPTADQGLAAVEPGLNNTTLKLYTTLYGMANLPAGFDPSFLDATTVFLKGQGHEYTLPATTQVAEFDDPFGAKTYMAYVPNYNADRIAPAYRLVQQAQQLREQWELASGAEKDRLASQLKEQIELLDIMREMHVIYGTLVY
jgi:hypothetical protein